MDERTRARLLRRADRLEHRLGVVADPETGNLRKATANEQQARALRLGGAARRYVVEVDDDEPEEAASDRQGRELLDRYAMPSRRPAAGSVGRGPDATDEERDRERRPRSRSVTEEQLIRAGLIPDPDDD